MVIPLKITLRDPEPLYRQVASELRSLILTGTLKPGDKLPTIQELARQWNSNYFTVQSAITILVKEGLLESLPRVGTFVRKTKPKLSSIGIYYSSDFWANREAGFYRLLHRAIQQRLAKERIQLISWIDERNSKKQGTPLPALRRALQRHEIQGLISPMVSGSDEQWLPRLSVPVAILGSLKMPGNIDFDSHQLLQLSLESLASQGCKDIGCINLMQQIKVRPDGSKHPYGEFYEQLGKIASNLKLNLQENWIQSPSPSQHLNRRFEQFGYAALNKIWAQKKRPQGILVYPDVVAWGVIVAVLERQIRVPKDLKLVFHQNVGLDYLCPFPATYVSADPAIVANLLLEQIKLQYNGKKALSHKIPYTVQPMQVHVDAGLK